MVRGVTSRSSRAIAFLVAASAAAWVFPDVAAHAQTPPPSAPTGKPERAVPSPPAQGSGTAPASDAPAEAARKTTREECERYVGLLTGREKDRELLGQAEVKAVARQAADLVTCGAVRADWNEPCSLLTESGRGDDCRSARELYHELRAHPNGRSFMFNDQDFEKCTENPAMRPVCETGRQAFISGDPNQCVIKADLETICRSLKGMDAAKCATEAPRLKKILEAHCRAKITLNEADCAVPGAEKMTEECRRDIRARKPYAKGLKEVAASGPARDKELAKAALDSPDACKKWAEPAMEVCLHPAPTDPRAGTAAPAATAPEKPKATQPSPPATTSPSR
jgi:hypothetical protein